MSEYERINGLHLHVCAVLMAARQQDYEDPYATFYQECLRFHFLKKCALYRQNQIRRVWDREHLHHLAAEDFAQVALIHLRTDQHFCLSGMQYTVLCRFVGLLSSMTLFHFSRTSKPIHYLCLDHRGVQFRTVDLVPRGLDRPVHYNIYEGMLCGRLRDQRLTPYQVCHGLIRICFDHHLQYPHHLNFVKRHKTIDLKIREEAFPKMLADLWPQIMHPGVEHVHVKFKSSSYIPGCISLKQLTQFLDSCRQVRAMNLKFKCAAVDKARPYSIVLQGDPRFANIRQVVESWARSSPKLVTFVMTYKNHMFLLKTEKVLKKCYKENYYWMSTGNYDIDANSYETFKYDEFKNRSWGNDLYYYERYIGDPLVYEIQAPPRPPDWVSEQRYYDQDYEDDYSFRNTAQGCSISETNFIENHSFC